MDVDQSYDGRNGAWKKFDVTVDSGAAHSVANGDLWPSVHRQESAGSRIGQVYLGPGQERIPNRGAAILDMKVGIIPIRSTFQVSQISKSLWSVGKLCDAGCTVQLGRDSAVVTHAKSGKSVEIFPRQHGL